jgi:hypothetical protein
MEHSNEFHFWPFEWKAQIKEDGAKRYILTEVEDVIVIT